MKLKNVFTNIFILALLVIVASVPLMVAQAAPISPQEVAPAAIDFDALLQSFFSLSGFAILVTAVVNILKTVGVIKDGQAGTWSAGINLTGLVALFLLQIAGKADLVPVIDAQAGDFSQVLTVVFGFAWQIYVSRFAHDKALAGLPVVGKSYSGRTAGENLTIIEAEYAK